MIRDIKRRKRNIMLEKEENDRNNEKEIIKESSKGRKLKVEADEGSPTLEISK